MNIARDIMSKKLVTLDSTVSAAEVAKIMDKNNVSCIVLTKDDKSQGIVTERDLLSKIIVPNKKSSELMAREIMTSPITSVSSHTPVDEVAQKMIDKKIRRVIVIDDGQPLGIITVTDFVKHLNTILSDSENSKAELYQNLIDEYEYWDN
ncbi:CBS domain-containing protein [Candidatus Pacearchaeota archaeon]|nr:CBS domain-containing protein [Candidatus Pacearchaeota archaeon]